MAKEFNESLYLDMGSEYFQEDVHSHEILDQYFRGFISKNELADRLEWMKWQAERSAQTAVEDEIPEAQTCEVESA